MSSSIIEPTASSTAVLPSPVIEKSGQVTTSSMSLSSAATLRAEWVTQLQLTQKRHHVRCFSERTRLAKRISDIVVSSIMLVLLSPVMLLVAIAVKLTSPGEVLFKQVRVGLNLRRNSADKRSNQADRRKSPGYGKPFVLYKFRTMRADAEKNGAQFAQKQDPRITSIGGFLRKSRLDELPQLWNVLRGEMSIVGPRPERPEFIAELEEAIPGYTQRLGMKPGLTGIAQVVNGYDNNIEGFRRKVEYDMMYLQNCCFWNDVKIMLRTVVVVLTGKGAL